tara:strand:+ start:2403 stop:2687 length:285 start_codon:yes stop_codon:yes gene_type:complete
MQKSVDRIIKEAAEKYNLPEEVIIAIFESPYKCARTKISKVEKEKLDSFVNIRFKKLGLLYADHAKIKAIENARTNRSSKSDQISRDRNSRQNS